MLPKVFFRFILLLDAMAFLQKIVVANFRMSSEEIMMSARTRKYSHFGTVVKIERNRIELGAVSGK